jgi:hypothetical protein
MSRKCPIMTTTLTRARTILDDQQALRLEYAKLLRRLDRLKRRVAKARKDGYPEHYIPRIGLGRLHGWARLYNNSDRAARRALGGR